MIPQRRGDDHANVPDLSAVGAELRPLHATQDTLGECPTWWGERQWLLWVDVREKVVRGIDFAAGERLAWPMPALTAGFCLTDRDALVVALEADLCRLDPQTGVFSPLSTAPQHGPDMRFNEMRSDASGRIWVGFMNDRTRAAEGWLLRVDGSGYTAVLDGVAVPNSLAWSPDGRVMFFADGVDPIIWQFAYDPVAGIVDDRRVFAELPSGGGIPDGAAVDRDGYLWSANYGGWALTRYAPDGAVDRIVEMPVAQPTSCAFGGDDMDILFVTTARQRLGDEQLRAQPLAGEIFAMRVGTPGAVLPRAVEERLEPAPVSASEGA